MQKHDKTGRETSRVFDGVQKNKLKLFIMWTSLTRIFCCFPLLQVSNIKKIHAQQ